MNSLSKQKIECIRRLYKGGIAIRIIMRECNISSHTVHKYINPNRHKTLTKDDIELINKLYNSGYGHHAIKTKTGWAIPTIKKYIKK